MTIAEGLLAEFDQELRTTRKFLEQLPDEKLNWKPHDKSMSAGELALHIATVPGAVAAFAQEDVVVAPDFGPNPQPKSVKEVLQKLDESAATVHQLLPKFDDRRMQATWTMTKDGQELLAIPRAAFLRSIMLNHW